METTVGNTRLPQVRLAGGAQRAQITASHVYGFLNCEHKVWLDFFGPRTEKLSPSPALDQLLRRGRDLEERLVAPLGWDEPRYERGRFDIGAAETRSLLATGVDGLRQGVLLEGPWLGIPDLLRRHDGESALGPFHYVVGDVKSSRKPRADQALQVAFYSLLLEGVQGRRPDHGFLVLQDGREERIDLEAIDVVLREVLDEMVDVLARGPDDPDNSRPHHSESCRDCAWRAVCSQPRDVYWVPGLTRSVRQVLAARGFTSLDALSLIEPRQQGRAGVLPEATWQRAKLGAQAVATGRPVFVRKPRLQDVREAATVVVALYDAFDARVPLVAWQSDGRVRVATAASRADEPVMWKDLLLALRSTRGAIVHGGGFPARVYEQRLRSALDPGLAATLDALEDRYVDLMSTVRGTWIFPEPVQHASEALAYLEGALPDEAPAAVPLLLEVGDFDALEQVARRELAALAALAKRLWSGA